MPPSLQSSAAAPMVHVVHVVHVVHAGRLRARAGTESVSLAIWHPI
ncbi:MAG: hypothetical protein P8N09_06385 [Planctomycetota bacterium]|nr:hypothetical protein [Planctomycetota bacterium]